MLDKKGKLGLIEAPNRRHSKLEEKNHDQNVAGDPTDAVLGDEEFLNELKDDPKSFYKLFETLMLCQNISVKQSKTNDYLYEPKTKEEGVVMNFCRLFNFNFLESSRSDHYDIYNCKMLGKEINYDISAINDFIYSREKFSILVRENYSGKNVLICKGTEGVLRSKLAMSEQESENFDRTLKFFEKNGSELNKGRL
jgi:magnesium-transporting ATPase (P-type)